MVVISIAPAVDSTHRLRCSTLSFSKGNSAVGGTQVLASLLHARASNHLKPKPSSPSMHKSGDQHGQPIAPKD